MTDQSSNAATSNATLEDLMVAMDVVDTLRHSDAMVARELDDTGRRQRLLERLRTMYQEQGIEVSDAVLKEGIDALEQERFQYQAVAPSWRTRLAHIWVSRASWSKPLLFLMITAVAFYAFYFAKEVWPQQQLRAKLPNEIDRNIAGIIAVAKSPAIVEQATALAARSRSELDRDNLSAAEQANIELTRLQAQLNQSYQIRVVARPNENSGIWRQPPNNPTGKNYYLIVEAIDKNNRVVAIDVLNEENNKRVNRKSWGLRVSETTFYEVAADKRDDGIIQANVVGEKLIGYLEPRFSVQTTGATITDW